MDYKHSQAHGTQEKYQYVTASALLPQPPAPLRRLFGYFRRRFANFLRVSLDFSNYLSKFSNFLFKIHQLPVQCLAIALLFSLTNDMIVIGQRNSNRN